METVTTCPLCRHPESRLAVQPTDHTVSHKPFDIRECAACGFRFTSPRPSQDEIGAYYLSDDYISHAASAHSLQDRIYRAVRQVTIRSKHRLLAGHQPAGNVLDLGCGTGDFLHYLQKHGYRSLGVEVSPNARKIAEAKGLQVVHELQAIDSSRTFDALTLWHVLEHVPDPKNTLQELHRKSNPGAFLIIAVPDRESWDANHYGPYWAAWDVPRHLSHFRQRDIAKILHETGFNLVQTRRMWFDAPYVATLSEQYRGAGKIGSLFKGLLVGCRSNVHSLFTTCPTSSSLFVARKA